MEILKVKFKSLKMALKKLDEILKILKETEKDSFFYKPIRDGTIKRFEYTIDSFWKFINIYLEIEKGVVFNGTSPKEILKAALKNKLINDDEYLSLFNAVSDRNITSHIYNENIAKNVVKNIFNYYQVILNIVNRIDLY